MEGLAIDGVLIDERHLLDAAPLEDMDDGANLRDVTLAGPPEEASGTGLPITPVRWTLSTWYSAVLAVVSST